MPPPRHPAPAVGRLARSTEQARPCVRIGAHETEILRNGRELFPRMIEAIASAQTHIALEMYWVGADTIGATFRDLLIERARDGVEVRVMLDGFGSAELPVSFFDEPLTRAGAIVRRYRPLLATFDPLRPHRLLARDHRKNLIADDVAFVGGINLARQWAPADQGGEDWRDTAIMVRGPDLARHLMNLFESSWARAKSQLESRVRPPRYWSTEGNRLGVLANTPEKRRGRKIRQAYLWGLRRAQKTIDITCAYFVPRPVFLRALKQAVKRGVRVRVLLPLRSDVWLADVLAESTLHMLSNHGVEVYGYDGSILHAKTAVVDGHWVTIGSHNLDALSWAYNLECNVFCDDEAVGRVAVTLFEDDLERSVRLPREMRGLLRERVSRMISKAIASAYALRI